MTEAEQRAKIAEEARKWLNTPYHNGADVLGAGVDCGMLLVRVFVDAGLVAPFDPRPYAPDWMLHRDGEKYLTFLGGRAHPVEKPGVGDIALFRYGRAYSHGGIVVKADPVHLVHSSHDARYVIEEALAFSPVLSDPKRKLCYYSIWPEAKI